MVHFLALILCRIFFKHIHISGVPTKERAVLWAVNHTSAIVDPTVLFGLAPVPLRPLAKLNLWKNPVMRFFLQLTQAIPVSRLQDMAIDEQLQKRFFKKQKFGVDWHRQLNALSFDHVARSLLQNKPVLIFPEGVSHDDPFLYPLKTGLARMAVHAVQKSQDPHFYVVIQPVIIDYSEKDEFRSELNLHYCQTIKVDHTQADIDKITQQVQHAMENDFARFSSWTERRNWRFLFEASQGRCPFSTKELRDFVNKHQGAFPKDSADMVHVQTIRRLLDVMGISPIQLVWGKYHYKKRYFLPLILAHSLFYLFLIFPVELFGLIVWTIPAKVSETLGNRSTSDRDVRATMKLAHGIWFFPLWAFSLSLVFTFVFKDQFYHVNGFLLWLIFLVMTPAFFALSLVSEESSERFFVFLKLAKLRFVFPRGWREFVQEWKSLSDKIKARIHD